MSVFCRHTHDREPTADYPDLCWWLDLNFHPVVYIFCGTALWWHSLNKKNLLFNQCRKERKLCVSVIAASQSPYLSPLLQQQIHIVRLSEVKPKSKSLSGNCIWKPIHKTSYQHPVLASCPKRMSPSLKGSLFVSVRPPEIPCRLLISQPMCVISPRFSGIDCLMMNAAGLWIFYSCCPIPISILLLTQPRDKHY